MRKLENQTNRSVVSFEVASAPIDPREPVLSCAQVAANRANSQLSTGPKTPEGKAKSSLNAVKTGLTGRTVLLASDDAAAYENHVRNYTCELRPATPREHALAQSLADNAWRLDRIPALEMAIYAQGHLEFADAFDEHDPALRPGLIELHTYLTYEKQLRNLHLQEMRLRRQREKDTAELRQLQQERDAERDRQLHEKKSFNTSALPATPSDPAQFGFDFSPADPVRFLDAFSAPNSLSSTVRNDHQPATWQAKAA